MLILIKILNKLEEKNIEKWPKLYKSEVAIKLLEKVRKHFKNYND